MGADRSWKVGDALMRFREKYWDRRWETFVARALTAFRNLRHRNAHPDWLAGSGALRSAERVTTAFDDLQFLVRFYGFMMLALVGIHAEPLFPAAVKEWKAPMVCSIGRTTGDVASANAVDPATDASEAPAGDSTES
jgi:hypothetical protein